MKYADMISNFEETEFLIYTAIIVSLMICIAIYIYRNRRALKVPALFGVLGGIFGSFSILLGKAFSMYVFIIMFFTYILISYEISYLTDFF